MDCMSRNLGCFLHKPADKLCIAGNVTRDRKLADCDSEFHINQEAANVVAKLPPATCEEKKSAEWRSASAVC
jgi:hypothetical protein